MFFPVKFQITNPPPVVVVLLFILVPLVWFGAPVLSIWSLNALFGTEIQLNLWTWLSAFWLMFIIMHRSDGK